MAKQSILPFFIPMEGCPYNCIYCDQRAITGQENSPDREQIIAAIDGFEGGEDAQIAFYGGSFTCLPQERQEYYLAAAAYGVKQGKVGGVRISTRPDAIDDEICRFLKEYGVNTVELGVQSFDDEVLRISGRCYDRELAQTACRTVVKNGIRLGVQLMTGLPDDTPEKDLFSVEKAALCGGELLRIYPALVLENTELAAMYRQGKYQPQSLEQAVSTAAEMCVLAHALHLTLIRVGINTSADVEKSLVAGPYHPAFGGLVKEHIKQGQIRSLLQGKDKKKPMILTFPPADIPLVFGDRKQAMCCLAAEYPLLALVPNAALPADAVAITIDEKTEVLPYDEYCAAAVSI